MGLYVDVRFQEPCGLCDTSHDILLTSSVTYCMRSSDTSG